MFPYNKKNAVGLVPTFFALFTGKNLSVLFNFVHSNVFPPVIIPDRLNN